eukprot:4287227-Prymnesium_polylepis.1
MCIRDRAATGSARTGTRPAVGRALDPPCALWRVARGVAAYRHGENRCARVGAPDTGEGGGGGLIRRVPDLCATGGGLRRPQRAAARDLGRHDPRL